MGEFGLSETLRGIIVQEQEHEIDLAAALGINVPRQLKQFYMKQINSLRGIHTLALVIFSLSLMPPARAQDATLTLTVASNSITAGDTIKRLAERALNAFEQSKSSWMFPPRIQSKNYFLRKARLTVSFWN